MYTLNTSIYIKQIIINYLYTLFEQSYYKIKMVFSNYLLNTHIIF